MEKEALRILDETKRDILARLDHIENTIANSNRQQEDVIVELQVTLSRLKDTLDNIERQIG